MVGQDLTPLLTLDRFDFSGTGDIATPAPSYKAVHFTYDDIPCGPSRPSIIRCIRTDRYKYAVYFTPEGLDADWELYDLGNDPLENYNLAGDPTYSTIQKSMEEELVQTMKKHKTLPLFPWPPRGTKLSRGHQSKAPRTDWTL